MRVCLQAGFLGNESAWVLLFKVRSHSSTGTQARGVARTRTCFMLAIQQLAGINRIEDAAECAPIACLSTCFHKSCVTMWRLPLSSPLLFSVLHLRFVSASWQALALCGGIAHMSFTVSDVDTSCYCLPYKLYDADMSDYAEA